MTSTPRAGRCSAWPRRARPPTCSPTRPAARPSPWPSCSTTTTGQRQLGAARRARRSSSTRPAWPPPTTSTASSASASERNWRLVCVGDPDQLPAVGRGGMFAHWCDTLPAHRLEEVRRFAEPWQAEASLALRAGDPRPSPPTPSGAGSTPPIPPWSPSGWPASTRSWPPDGATVAITTARADTARDDQPGHPAPLRLLALRPRPPGSPTAPASGPATASPPAATTPPSSPTRAPPVRNRQTWTVTAVGADGSLTVAEPGRGRVTLPADYVPATSSSAGPSPATATRASPSTTASASSKPTSSRAGIYVGMTRGRDRNVAWVVDATGSADPAETLTAILQRPANAITAHAARDRLHREHDLAVTPDEPVLAREALPVTQRRPKHREPPGLSL